MSQMCGGWPVQALNLRAAEIALEMQTLEELERDDLGEPNQEPLLVSNVPDGALCIGHPSFDEAACSCDQT